MNLREALEEALRKRPFLEEALQEELINLSSLARQHQPEIAKLTGKEVKESALVMAIRRREPRLQLKMQHKLQQFIASLGDIIVRSNLVTYTYVKTSGLPAKQAAFLASIKGDTDGFHSFTGGMEETTIIVSEKYRLYLEDAMKGEEILSTEKDPSSITLRLPSSSSEVIGLYYFFITASAGVPIMRSFQRRMKPPIVHSEDVTSAFTTINTKTTRVKALVFHNTWGIK